MKTTHHLLLAIGLAASSVPMFADFTYNDFSSTAGLQLNGNAASVDNVLRLTPADFWQAGSAFSTNTVSLASSASFSTFFQFQIHDDGGISDEDGQGADGIVFTVQTVSNNVGSSGGGIGYFGIPQSLGVEFDTYNNGGGYDPNGNHVNFDYNGNFSSDATAVEIPERMNDDGVWSAWVDYDGATQSLELRLVENSTVRPADPLLQANVDLASILGSTDAFVGFTSATGAAYDDHDILNWQFRQDFNPITNPTGGGAVPEPSTYGLIGAAALLGLAGLRRRARRA
jgi:hypothetical protein